MEGNGNKLYSGKVEYTKFVCIKMNIIVKEYQE